MVVELELEADSDGNELLELEGKLESVLLAGEPPEEEPMPALDPLTAEGEELLEVEPVPDPLPVGLDIAPEAEPDTDLSADVELEFGAVLAGLVALDELELPVPADRDLSSSPQPTSAADTPRAITAIMVFFNLIL